ncbi:unnamed protein product [Pedinophyceae sp. YPF-701]|nr:unnamed protein product [Pedinophyceae sp. YPF-701]
MEVDSPNPNKGSHTIVFENFLDIKEQKKYSEPFEIAGFEWRILLFPKGNSTTGGDAEKSVSVYLDAPKPQGVAVPLEGWARAADFTLVLVHPSGDPSKDHSKNTSHTFDVTQNDWGFSGFHPLKSLEEDGFLHPDGSLHVRVVLEVLRGPQHPGYDPKRETGFVGLKNQGATCYMNSLLQVLFHIPWFRKTCYQLPVGEDEQPDSSLPAAMQQLFFRLQYGSKPVSTKLLTKSFGWDSFDAFQQHDVQELARVLMDRLEAKMKGTAVEKDLDRMFQGHTVSFVRCLHVDFRSERKESYQDLQLDVKGCKDLYDSFDKYCEVDRLDDKYDAEGHGMQEAERGVLFDSFPPVLFLHLKRFDWDLDTFQQVKINDHHDFPAELDLQRYLHPKASGHTVQNTYRLFAVMVHMGGMYGGHYYTYINPDGTQWLKFDDERVEKVDEATVKEAAGVADPAQRTGSMRLMRSTGSAYMLVYTRDADRDQVFCEADRKNLPEHMATQLDAELKEKITRWQEKREAHLYCHVSVARECDVRAQVAEHAFGVCERAPRVWQKRVLNETKLSEIIAEMEREYGIRANKQQLWVIGQRRNGTFRVDSALREHEVRTQTVQDVARKAESAGYKRALSLYLEEMDSASVPQDTSRLVFLKIYDAANSRLHFVRAQLFPLTSKVEALGKYVLRECKGNKELAPLVSGLDAASLDYFEELSDTPDTAELDADRAPARGMLQRLNPRETLEQVQTTNGDVIIVQAQHVPEKCQFPRVADFLEWTQARRVLRVRRRPGAAVRAADGAELPKEVEVEVQSDDSYEVWSQKVAEAVGVRAGGTHLRFWQMHRFTRNPSMAAVPTKMVGTVGEVTGKTIWEPDFVFYEALDIPLAQLEAMSEVTVCWHDGRGEYVEEFTVRRMKDDTVNEVLEEVRERAANGRGKRRPEGPLRLLEVASSRVHKVLRRDVKVESLPNDRSLELRAEECPQGEDPEALVGSEGDDAAAAGEERKLVCVAHCQRERVTQESQGVLRSWGEPLLLVLEATDRPEDVRRKVAERTGDAGVLKDAEGSPNAVHINVSGRYTALAEDQAVLEALGSTGNPFEYISSHVCVEHPDTRPPSKRREHVVRSGGRAERGAGIKINS